MVLYTSKFSLCTDKVLLEFIFSAFFALKIEKYKKVRDFLIHGMEIIKAENSTEFLQSCALSYLTILQIPKRTNWEEYIPQDSDQWESQMAVSSLFDERPVWPKDSVTERLLNKGFIFSDHMLRRLSTCILSLSSIPSHCSVG